mgnify:CR=1 FL=1
MEIISRSLAETADLAAKILAELAEKGHGNKATLVALQGDLGSGKTTFTQAVARTLGIKERVTSPTFVIMKKYLVNVGTWKSLIHIDCYRLDGADDLLHLGWNELAANPENLILVEWPERVGNLLLSPALKINFEVVGETARKIIYG